MVHEPADRDQLVDVELWMDLQTEIDGFATSFLG
jgi:hypothetical protein